MKIKKIETIPIKLQMKEPFVIANVTNFDMYYVIVRLETDSGIVGYGEATPAWEVTGETYRSVMAIEKLFTDKNTLGYSVIGSEITTLNQIELLVNKICGDQLVYGNPSAKAALEQAIFDAFGKYINKPIYEIYDGKNKDIVFTKNISIHDIATTLAEVENGIKEGYGIIRLKIGVKDAFGLKGFQRDVEVIKKAYEIVKKNKKTRLIADANQGFKNSETTINFCRKVEGRLDWLEQPALAGDMLAFAEIKKKTSLPLMADESVHSLDDLRILVRLGGIDYLNIKLMKTGGLINAIKIADLAEKSGIKFQIGSMLESSIGAAMGCQFYCIRPQAVSTDLNSYCLLKNNIASGLKIVRNTIQLSTEPGNGIKLNDEMIEEFRID